MVMYAPGGLASLIMMNVRVAAAGLIRPLLAAYLALAGTGAVLLLGLAAVIEMIYHLQLSDSLGSQLQFLGLSLNAKGLDTWFGALFVVATGAALFELARRRFAHDWGEAQAHIEASVKRLEAA